MTFQILLVNKCLSKLLVVPEFYVIDQVLKSSTVLGCLSVEDVSPLTKNKASLATYNLFTAGWTCLDL